MKLDPGMHIGLHLVFFGKTDVTHPLLSSPLIYFPCFMYSTPKEILTSRNFGFLVIFSPNHSPKILLTFFLGHQLSPGFLLVTE
jgi:hypothetical protein